MTAGVWFIFRVLHETPLVVGAVDLQLPASAIEPWTLTFALGVLSHLLSDAWTHAGIRPLLPFSAWRFWMVPKLLRGKSNGPIDFLARFIAMLGILAGVVAFAVTQA